MDTKKAIISSLLAVSGLLALASCADARGGAADKADAGVPHLFKCGGEMCDAATQFCLHLEGQADPACSGDYASCQDYPPECGAAPSCDCVPSECEITACTENDGEIVGCELDGC